MKLIGLNGKKRAGKDTAYKLIKVTYEGNWFQRGLDAAPAAERVERRSFADSLKIIAALTLGYEGEDADLISAMDEIKETGYVAHCLGDSHGPESITGRLFLQNLGNHARNVFGDTFWVDQVAPYDNGQFSAVWTTRGRRTPDSMSVGMPAIGCITDVRYPNEAERVLNLGGIVIEVVRPSLEDDGDTHVTEKPLPRELVTATVVNDGTLEDFGLKLQKIVERS